MRLFLIHGFCGSPASWDVVRQRLGARFDVVAPAVGGHLDVPSPRDFDDEVDRLAALVNAPATICGYSLGGRLALGILRRHPAKVAALILVGANPGLASAQERAARARDDEAWARRLEGEGLAAFLERWEAQPLFATQRALTESQREAQRRDRLRHDPRALASAMRVLGLARMPSAWDAIAKSHVPIDFVAGGEDAKFTALGRRVAAEAPRGRFFIVHGAGHNVVLERAEVLADVIASSTEARGGS